MVSITSTSKLFSEVERQQNHSGHLTFGLYKGFRGWTLSSQIVLYLLSVPEVQEEGSTSESKHYNWCYTIISSHCQLPLNGPCLHMEGTVTVDSKTHLLIHFVCLPHCLLRWTRLFWEWFVCVCLSNSGLNSLWVSWPVVGYSEDSASLYL